MTTKKDELILNRGERSFDMPRARLHHHELPNAEAQFAMALLERWGMVLGTENAEDSAGRAKVGPMPVEETVERACSVAGKAFEAFRERGWMLDVPSMSEMEDKLQEMENSNEKRNGKGEWVNL